VAGAAAPADGGSKAGAPPQRLLFSLDVNLGGAHGKVPLDVHAGAVPADLAQQFATQYGLGSTAVAQLTEAIVSEAKQKVRYTPEAGSVALDAGSVQAQALWSRRGWRVAERFEELSSVAVDEVDDCTDTVCVMFRDSDEVHTEVAQCPRYNTFHYLTS